MQIYRKKKKKIMQTACFFDLKVKYIRVYVVKQLASFDMMFFVKTLGSK